MIMGVSVVRKEALIRDSICFVIWWANGRHIYCFLIFFGNVKLEYLLQLEMPFSLYYSLHNLSTKPLTTSMLPFMYNKEFFSLIQTITKNKAQISKTYIVVHYIPHLALDSSSAIAPPQRSYSLIIICLISILLAP